MTWPVGCALWLSIMASATGGSGTCFAQTYLQGPPGEPLSPSSQNWENSLQNWKNNPNNWQNSSANFQNTPQDWRNSPQNWENSAQNYNNKNGIYDRNGNRIGHAVPRADGSGMNFFDNSGRRLGYQNDNNR
jgi:hypothetical protein